MIKGSGAVALEPLHLLTFVVGDTGIEPVTPTVSTFTIWRWLRWFRAGPAGCESSLRWPGWL
jgi:hypothetical protein